MLAGPISRASAFTGSAFTGQTADPEVFFAMVIVEPTGDP
jgi:hypothetical protein